MAILAIPLQSLDSHMVGCLVGWSLVALVSTNTAISETKTYTNLTWLRW